MAKLKKLVPAATPFDLSKMCTPATLYFAISLIFLVFMGFTNLEQTERLCLGDYSCYVGNNALVFILNAIYIIFWTFILDLLCKNGYANLSWFILLLPFILSLVLLLLLMIKGL